MVGWLFRRLRNLVCTMLVLAGLVALTEVGLRISRLTGRTPATTPVSQSWRRPSPTTGWELPRLEKIVPDAARPEFSWTTNSWGQRGPEPVLPKPEETYRVLCLGETALLGVQHPEAVLFPARLQPLLQARSRAPVEMLSTALPDGCPLTLTLAYRLGLASLQPDLVLVQVSAGSLIHDRRYKRWTVKDARGFPLACVNPEFSRKTPSNLVVDCRQEFALVDFALTELARRTGQTDAAPEPLPEAAPPSVDEMESLLGPLLLLKDLCYTQRCRVVVWLAPTARSNATLAEHRALVATAIPWLTEQGIPAVDALACLHPEMVEVNDGWTAAGHQALAEYVGSQLLTNLPGPWTAPYATPVTVPAGFTTEKPLGLPEIQRPNR